MDVASSIEFSAMILIAVMAGRAGFRGHPIWIHPLLTAAFSLIAVFAAYMLFGPNDLGPQPLDLRLLNARNGVVRAGIVGGGLGLLLWLGGMMVRRLRKPRGHA